MDSARRAQFVETLDFIVGRENVIDFVWRHALVHDRMKAGRKILKSAWTPCANGATPVNLLFAMSYFAKAWRCTALEDRLEMAGSAKAAWSPRTNSSAPTVLSTPSTALTG